MLSETHILDGVIKNFNEECLHGSVCCFLDYSTINEGYYRLYLNDKELMEGDQVEVVECVKQMCRERGIPNEN
ncbi:hypothetical protein KAT92_05500 [Candidatus Babeliales bacterium]|nr:hypothetical protein [Candidatus Babeliales bacterium]